MLAQTEPMPHISRRTFLQRAAAGTAVVAWPSARARAQTPAPTAWKVGGFTKTIQDLSFEETARVAAEAGWDGIELALRAGGHVLPERVDDDLPKLAAALRARGREILGLATDIRTADALSEKVLRAAAGAGIRFYRIGMPRYRDGIPIPKQLDEIRAQLKDLAALNAQLGITGMMQNHSGNGYVGAALWDIHLLTDGFDPRHFGVHFDIGHATIEGGLSWPTNFALVKDRVGAVIVKDFAWKFTPGQGGTPVWCPIGRGMINPKFFTLLRASGFHGPVMMEFEYPFENASVGARLRAFQADNTQLRTWLKKA
jgi:sugar phosphate isomerase/epimerase